MSAARGLAAALLVALAAGCHHAPEQPAVRARFGIFFGGQVEERAEVPLIVDRAKQNIGIRLEFEDPPSSEEPVHWELEKPSTARGHGPSDTLVEYGDVHTRPGESVLDVPLAFRPGDRTGAWHVRATVAGKSVLDRAFKVIPAREAPEQ